MADFIYDSNEMLINVDNLYSSQFKLEFLNFRDCCFTSQLQILEFLSGK